MGHASDLILVFGILIGLLAGVPVGIYLGRRIR